MYKPLFIHVTYSVYVSYYMEPTQRVSFLLECGLINQVCPTKGQPAHMSGSLFVYVYVCARARVCVRVCVCVPVPQAIKNHSREMKPK